MIHIDKQAVKGELPDDVFDAIDWGRLGWCAREVVNMQKHDTRKKMYEAFQQGEDGPIMDFDLSPFDVEGWTLIRFQGQPLLRLHVSRLMPGAPLEFSDMKPVPKEG